MEKDLRQKRSVGGNLSAARVLIVEDQFEVAELLDAAVSEAGGQVVAIARTIDEALTAIRSEAISAAIVTMIARVSIQTWLLEHCCNGMSRSR